MDDSVDIVQKEDIYKVIGTEFRKKIFIRLLVTEAQWQNAKW